MKEQHFEEHCGVEFSGHNFRIKGECKRDGNEVRFKYYAVCPKCKKKMELERTMKIRGSFHGTGYVCSCDNWFDVLIQTKPINS